MNRTARGFTLVEVLTVATIIALLIAIMLPTFSRVMDLAREIDCRNNLKRVAEIVVDYCQQNKDWLPKNDQEDKYPKTDPNEEEELLGDRSNLRWWCNKVYSYGSKRKSLYMCPADEQRAEIGMIVTCGYGFNNTLTNPDTLSAPLKGDNCQTLSGVKNSATTALIGHCNDVPEVDEEPAIIEKMAADEFWPGVHVKSGGSRTGRCGFVMASGDVQTFTLKQALQLADPNGVLLLFHK